MALSSAFNQQLLEKNILWKFDGILLNSNSENSVRLEKTFNGFTIHQYTRYERLLTSTIKSSYLLGKIHHPNLLIGNSSLRGKLKYELAVTENAYFILVGLQLEELQFEEAEQAPAILAMINRNEFPPAFNRELENHKLIAKEMLLPHFERLFENFSSKEDLKGWQIKGQFLNRLVNQYFKQLNLE